MTITQSVDTGIRRAGAADRTAVAATVAAGFFIDPVTQWLLPDVEHRRKVILPMFEVYIDAYLPHGETFLTADGNRAAVWLPPEAQLLAAEQEQAFVHAVAALVGPGVDRLFQLEEAFAEHHPAEPLYYCKFLSTVPAFQGRGIGSAFLWDMLQRADADELPAYHEATSPRNRALYERHGMSAAVSSSCPMVGPPCGGCGGIDASEAVYTSYQGLATSPPGPPCRRHLTTRRLGSGVNDSLVRFGPGERSHLNPGRQVHPTGRATAQQVADVASVGRTRKSLESLRGSVAPGSRDSGPLQVPTVPHAARRSRAAGDVAGWLCALGRAGRGSADRRLRRAPSAVRACVRPPSPYKGRKASSPSGSAPPKILCFLPCMRSLWAELGRPPNGETGRGPLTAQRTAEGANHVRANQHLLPECGDAVEDMAPENWRAPGQVPGLPARGGPDGAVSGDDPRWVPAGRAGRGRPRTRRTHDEHPNEGRAAEPAGQDRRRSGPPRSRRWPSSSPTP